MNELSIEEKAKRYDEALEKARQLCAYPTSKPFISDLQDLFPELQESEDERMRRWIINYLDNKALNSGIIQEKTNIKNAIAWLEKQGQDGKVWFYRDDYVKDKKQAYQDGIDKVLNNPQKYGLEKQCEQKPADKVEQKFKVGDFVVNENGYIRQIIDFKDDVYCCLRQECCDDKSNPWIGTIEYVDTYWHLWTIQDAKDGDVLAFNDGHGNDCIELIKSITDKKIEFWFCLTNGNRYEVFDGIIPYTNLVSRENATPATKEQRDQLEKAIADAGYEWDSEKKELKKIEQKPAWSEDDENGLADAIWAIKQARTIAKDENDMGNLWYAERWLNSLRNKVIPQPKQKWNEKDEKILNSAISYLEMEKEHRTSLGVHNISVAIDWLKSLKDRYTWKPSDEQLDALEKECIAHSNYELCRLLEQLKKLKG